MFHSQKRFYVDFLLNNWMLVLVALMSGGMLIWQVKNGGGGQAGLTVADAVQKMNREKAVMVDVRDAAEYGAERIAQSKHVPLAELADKLPQVVKNKKTPVLFICSTGMRSGRAAAVARKMGYEECHNVAGGMRSWKAANMPLQTAKA